MSSIISINLFDDKPMEKPEVEKIPGWKHVNPISTQIDYESLLAVINNTAKNPMDVYNYDCTQKKYVEREEYTMDDLCPKDPSTFDYTSMYSSQQKDAVK